MTLNQLKYFMAVCEYGSFANAAKALFVSQPAVSQAVRELENSYGISLFDRKNNQLVITEDGQWLRMKAENLINISAELEKDLSERAKARHVIKIGVAPMVGNIYFYPLIDEIRSAFPHIVLDIREAGSLEIRRWLSSNLVDIAFCLLDCFEPDEVSMQQLCSMELKFCVNKTHPLADRKILDFADIAPYRICMLREDSFQNIILSQQFQKANVNMDVQMYSSQLNSIYNMIIYSNCGAFLLEGSIKGEDIVYIPIKQPVTISLGLVQNKAVPEFSYINEFQKYLVACLKRAMK